MASRTEVGFFVASPCVVPCATRITGKGWVYATLWTRLDGIWMGEGMKYL